MNERQDLLKRIVVSRDVAAGKPVTRGTRVPMLLSYRGSRKEGELLVIPKGTEHKPVAQDEMEVSLLEPKPR